MRFWWGSLSGMRTLGYTYVLSKLGSKTHDKANSPHRKRQDRSGIHKHQNQHGRTAASTKSLCVFNPTLKNQHTDKFFRSIAR